MQDEKPGDEKKMGYKLTSELTLQDYVRVVIIRKWVIIPIFLLSLFGSMLYVQTTSPVYESQVLLMRETASERIPADIIGVSLVSETWDESHELLLKSGSFLAEIKQRFFEEHDFEVAIGQLEEDISLSGHKGSSTVLELRATANSPEQAQTLANIAADTFIKRITSMKRTELGQGLKFLAQQMTQFEKKIQGTEQALSDFRDKEGLVLTSEGASSGLIERLGNMQGELLKTENEIEIGKSQLQSVEELISEKRTYAKSSSATHLSPQFDQLQERLINLQLEMSTKLETLTEKDPEVIALQNRIDVIQKQLKTEFDELLEGPGTASLDPISELQGLMQQLVTLNVQLRGLERKAALITEKIDKYREEHPELISKQIELTRLKRQARIYEQTSAALMSKYEDMRLLEQMKTSGIRIVDKASLPKSPIKPKKMLVLVMGLFLGLFLGVIVVFFQEYLDDSIKRKEDVERFLELPFMGAIPKMQPFHVPAEALNWRERSRSDGDLQDVPVPGVRRRNKHRLAHRKKNLQRFLSNSLLFSRNEALGAPAMESYRNLAANIKYANIDSPIKSLLVTSALPGEGKTITASNLAIVMAQSGTRVLLVDSDLRRPRFHSIFRQDRAPGLTDLLVSDGSSENMTSDPPLSGFIRPATIENLFLLPCGVHVSNPGVLFPSEKMRDLVESLAQQYELVIFDSAPVGSVADAVNLSTEVDGTLMVISSGKTKRRIGLQVKESLDNVNADIIGAVLNNVDYSKQYGYYYYNYKYYSSDDKEDSV